MITHIYKKDVMKKGVMPLSGALPTTYPDPDKDAIHKCRIWH